MPGEVVFRLGCYHHGAVAFLLDPVKKLLTININEHIPSPFKKPKERQTAAYAHRLVGKRDDADLRMLTEFGGITSGDSFDT